MKIRALALIVGFVMVTALTGCSTFTEEQRTLDQFVTSLKQGDYSGALSQCFGAEHVRLKSGMNLIYFHAVVPTGKAPAFLGGNIESDSYPGSISREGMGSIHSWSIKGVATGVNILELASRAPSGCYVLETRAYGLVGFMRVDNKPKICFIVFTHG